MKEYEKRLKKAAGEMNDAMKETIMALQEAKKPLLEVHGTLCQMIGDADERVQEAMTGTEEELLVAQTERQIIREWYDRTIAALGEVRLAQMRMEIYQTNAEKTLYRIGNQG